MAEGLAVNLCGFTLKNPVIAASGMFGFGREYGRYFDVSLLGGIALKALTLKPREGNAPPRIAETPSGVLNAIGLQNPGFDAFAASELKYVQKLGTTVIANIAGTTEAEYCALAEKVSELDGIDALELNISCPNVKEGCMAFGATPEGVLDIVKKVRPYTKKPLIVKLTPNTGDIAACARAAEEGGADAISLINTLTGMAVDVHRRRPILANVSGGLSGPAVRPVALHMVYVAHKAVSIPIIGMGGIASGEDAVAFMLCGATAVMIGTAGMANPTAWIDIIAGIERYMAAHRISDASSLTGALEV